jgi:hypothetical protein
MVYAVRSEEVTTVEGHDVLLGPARRRKTMPVRSKPGHAQAVTASTTEGDSRAAARSVLYHELGGRFRARALQTRDVTSTRQDRREPRSRGAAR